MGFLSGLWEGISFLVSRMNFEKLLGEDRGPSGCIKQLSDLPLRLWVVHFHHLQLLLQNRANATAMVIHAGTLALVFADILVLSNLQHVRIFLKYRYAIIFCMCRFEHNYKISSTTDRFHLQLSPGKLREIMLEMFSAQCTLSKVMKLTRHALNHVCFDFCVTWLRLLNKWLQQNICLWKKRWSLKGNVPVKIPKKLEIFEKVQLIILININVKILTDIVHESIKNFCRSLVNISVFTWEIGCYCLCC